MDPVEELLDPHGHAGLVLGRAVAAARDEADGDGARGVRLGALDDPDAAAAVALTAVL